MKFSRDMNKRTEKRIIRHSRVRKKINGYAEKPRLNVFRGTRGLFAQVIDDEAGKTMLGLATYSKEVKEQIKNNNKEAAKKLGEVIGKKCLEKGIKEVVFDRGGYKFHGVIKEFADAVRASGIKL